MIPLLAEQFTVYTYDRRGRGHSTDTAPYAPEREIEDLEALIAHAGSSAHLYGYSSGASSPCAPPQPACRSLGWLCSSHHCKTTTPQCPTR